MKRRACPAARLIVAELAADLAQQRFDRTRSHRARIALELARTEALKARMR